MRRKDYTNCSLALNPKEHKLHQQVVTILDEVRKNKFEFGSKTQFICESIIDHWKRIPKRKDEQI